MGATALHQDLIEQLEGILLVLDERELALPAIHVAHALDSLRACSGSMDGASGANLDSSIA